MAKKTELPTKLFIVKHQESKHHWFEVKEDFKKLDGNKTIVGIYELKETATLYIDKELI